jgi:hypothetical protein
MTAIQDFAQPGLCDMPYAIEKIVRGLAADEPVIAFPPLVSAASWLLGAFPATLKDRLARSRLVAEIAYWRARAGGAANGSGDGSGARGAGGAPAAPTPLLGGK